MFPQNQIQQKARWGYAAIPSATNWQTPLNFLDELNFRHWVQRNNVPFDPNDPHSDYDMRGFWQAQQKGDPQAQRDTFGNMHFPDTWKTPYHETFSNQSMYANPKLAGHWIGNKFYDATGNLIKDETSQ